MSSSSFAEAKEETEKQEHIVGCSAGEAGRFLSGGGGGVGWDGSIPICVCLVGPLDLLQDYVTPIETLGPGT